MPYKSPEKLNELIKRALEDSSIQQGIADINLSPERLTNEIQSQAEAIWEAATSITSRFDMEEQELLMKQSELEKRLPRKPQSEYKYYYFGEKDWIAVTAGVILGVMGIVYLLRKVFGWFDFIENYPRVTTTLLIGLSAVAFLLMVYYAVGRTRAFLFKRQRKRQNAATEAWAAVANLMQRDLGIDQLQERLLRTSLVIDAELIEKVIKDRMRLFINRNLDASYEMRLTILEAPGLAEVIDPSRTIDTAAKTRLRFMLESMPGGSIGIAGPRGAGKSTLIHAYCGPNKIVDKINDRKILPILVSAPVEYDARDFILYLFSAACQGVLDIHGIANPRPELQDDTTVTGAAPNRFLGDILRIGPRLCVNVGAGLVLLGLTIAILLAVTSRQAKTNAPAAGQPAAASSPTATPTPQPSESFTTEVIKQLEIKPGSILVFGICLYTVGFALQWSKRRAWGQRIPTTFPRSPDEYFSAPEYRRDEWRKEAEGRGDLRLIARLTDYERGRGAETPDMPGLARDALDLLRDLKFQQSYTSGWSGGLKLPIGLEAGIERAVTLARNQMSNPEIVSSFTKFLGSIPDTFKIIIGIDELDKLKSDEQAHKFLNEIKSIFGLPRCFYLISVSENAMSNFERRGLPFRDVFDSSFDSIVYVDYLSLQAAKELIARRVVGKPVPFICLSYCLSGGLPRDLIRAFRALLEIRQNDPKNDDLSAICKALIRAETKAKIRASTVSAKRIAAKPFTSQFLEKLNKLENDDGFSALLLKKIIKEMLTYPPPASDDSMLPDDKLAQEKLYSLSLELGTYLYYLLTIMELFENSLKKATLQEMEKNGSLEYLARAKQTLAIDTNISLSLMNTFREQHHLTVPDYLKITDNKSRQPKRQLAKQVKSALVHKNGSPQTQKSVGKRASKKSDPG